MDIRVSNGSRRMIRRRGRAMGWKDFLKRFEHHGLGLRRIMAGAAVVLALGLPMGEAKAQTQEAAACVQRIGNDTLRAAQVGSAQAFYSVIRQHTDSGAVAMFSLGQYRKLLPDERRSDYVRLIELFIAQTFADNYRKFRAAEIVVEGVAPQGNTYNVQTKLIFLGGRPSQKVIWRVTPDCKIIDVNVTNVWLGQLLRSSVTGAIQKGGQRIDAAFTYLAPSGAAPDVKINR